MLNLKEVLEAFLQGASREAVLALTDTGEAAAKRAGGAAAALGATVRPLLLRQALEEMIADRSEVVRAIATHHLAELGPPDAGTEVRTLA